MATRIWTIKTMLDWMEDYLSKHEDSNPKLSSQWLISDATSLTRTELYINLDRPLSSEELDLLRTGVKRRAAGEPLQYITGKAPFRHITLDVAPGVLIPRPETEVLVSEILSALPKPKPRRAREYMDDVEVGDGEDPVVSDGSIDRSGSDSCEKDDANKGASRLKVADLCTGSGCIACSLAYENENIDVVATDISDEALKLAKHNVDKLGFSDRISILNCNIADAIVDGDASFDAVVSNPPYIPSAVLPEIPEEVLEYEPIKALDGGDDGLAFLDEILKASARLLKSGGVLGIELFETKLDQAADRATAMGFRDIRIVDDLAGRPRVLLAYKP